MAPMPMLDDERSPPMYTCCKSHSDILLARWGTDVSQRRLTYPKRFSPPLTFNLKQLYIITPQSHGVVCGVAIGSRGTQDKRVKARGAARWLPRETRVLLGVGLAGWL